MTTTPTSGAADLPEALRIEDALNQADRAEAAALSYGEGTTLGIEAYASAKTIRALHSRLAALAAGQATAAQAVVPAELSKPLKDAARSLESIQLLAGKDEYMSTMEQVREYAASRARVAQAALAAFEDVLAAAPAQPAAQQGVAYAALPTPYCYEFREPKERYTTDQMRAFADATHALRASHGQAPAQADDFGSAEHWKEKAQYWAGVAHRLRGEALRGEPVDGIIQPVTTAQAAQQAPAGATSPWSRALEIRIAQGWMLKGDRLPVLYTDTINGDGVGRDDLWLCTTSALAAPAAPSTPASGGAKQANICTDCYNADSWGLPDRPCCGSCRGGSNWQPLNASSVNPHLPASPTIEGESK